MGRRFKAGTESGQNWTRPGACQPVSCGISSARAASSETRRPSASQTRMTLPQAGFVRPASRCDIHVGWMSARCPSCSCVSPRSKRFFLTARPSAIWGSLRGGTRRRQSPLRYGPSIETKTRLRGYALQEAVRRRARRGGHEGSSSRCRSSRASRERCLASTWTARRPAACGCSGPAFRGRLATLVGALLALGLAACGGEAQSTPGRFETTAGAIPGNVRGAGVIPRRPRGVPAALRGEEGT